MFNRGSVVDIGIFNEKPRHTVISDSGIERRPLPALSGCSSPTDVTWHSIQYRQKPHRNAQAQKTVKESKSVEFNLKTHPERPQHKVTEAPIMVVEQRVQVPLSLIYRKGST